MTLTKVCEPMISKTFGTGAEANAASQAEAEAGTEDTKYLTSLKTKQAIDSQVPGTAREYTQAQNFDQSTLSISASAVDWDVESNQNALLVLTENVTINDPINCKEGGSYVLVVKQDATGGRTITWSSKYKWNLNGSAPAHSSGPNDISIFVFYCIFDTHFYGQLFWQES